MLMLMLMIMIMILTMTMTMMMIITVLVVLRMGLSSTQQHHSPLTTNKMVGAATTNSSCHAYHTVGRKKTQKKE